MDAGLSIQRCVKCDLRNFPEHLLCSRCGGSEWETERAFDGTIVRLTYSRRRLGTTRNAGPITVALVELDAGPLVVARGEEGLELGARVKLAMDETTPVAFRDLG